MANHSHVFTKKYITKEFIDSLINEISINNFKGKLVNTSSPMANGKQMWLVEYRSNDRMFFTNTFWIVSNRHIEFRNGCGDLVWWFQYILKNHIASKLDGRIRDDAVGVIAVEYPVCDFMIFSRRMRRHMSDKMFNAVMRGELEILPPEFTDMVSGAIE